MKKIYVLLMHTNTVPSKLIRFFTNYQYSHVGISLDKSCDAIYSFGRKTLHSIINSGFCIEHKDGAFFKEFNKTICKIYELNVTDKQFENVQNILEEMSSNSDKYKYDFFGIIPRFFGIPLTIKNRFVCSYFVAFVLEQARIYNFDKDVSMIEPKDFAELYGLHEIYDGQYLQYK